MKNNFKEFTNMMDCLERYGAICVSENFSWTKSFVLPNMSLDLPETEKKSKISLIILKRNPIYVQLSDGTKLYFTHSEFRRINPQPEVGKIMAVKMLRLASDNGTYPSQITNCQVL